MDISGTFNRTIKTVFIHYDVFYQFSTNEWRRFLLEVWEDFCAYMAGDKRNILLGTIHPLYAKHTNVNHTCPYYPGTYFVKINNVSVNAFAPLQFVPAGRYRVVLNMHEGYKGRLLGISTIYGSVSDHRIERF